VLGKPLSGQAHSTFVAGEKLAHARSGNIAELLAAALRKQYVADEDGQKPICGGELTAGRNNAVEKHALDKEAVLVALYRLQRHQYIWPLAAIGDPVLDCSDEVCLTAFLVLRRRHVWQRRARHVGVEPSELGVAAKLERPNVACDVARVVY